MKIRTVSWSYASVKVIFGAISGFRDIAYTLPGLAIMGLILSAFLKEP